jgi:transposase-like protein
MKYTIRDFNKQFPDNEACLQYLFESLYPNAECPECGRKNSYHLRKGSSHYVCNCGKSQISPKANTIFKKSSTNLYDWFFAIFLMSQSRNGVAAMEIKREVGVTYKTAWRMMNQIRKLMQENDHFLFGEIEADETYIGGKKKGKRGRGAAGKTIVAGTLQRDGKLNTKVVKNVKASTLIDQFKDKIAKGSHLLTDELRSYGKIAKQLGFVHRTVNHGSGEYAKKDGTSVNRMENFWSQLKRSLDGTYHVVSPKYLPLYVSEFQFRRNHQNGGLHLFDLLLGRVSLKQG